MGERVSFGAVIAAAIAIIILVIGLRDAFAPRPDLDTLYLEQLSFSDLPSWRADDEMSAAIPALLRSCDAIAARDPSRPTNPSERLPEAFGVPSLGGLPEDWTALCAAARDLPAGDDAAARRFIETYFVPMRIAPAFGDNPALITGYFEPRYAASRTPQPGLVPVLTKPEDMVTIDLSAFGGDLPDRDLIGRVEGNRVRPYPDHRALIESPPESSEALAYVDPDDLLFLQIQGSGQLAFEDGEVLRVGYAAKNGHPYYAIGRTLIERGILTRETVSMQSIRDWLESASPEDAAALRYENASYVFFRAVEGLEPPPAGGPVGAQGVQLSPLRSLAVDYRFYPYGAPVWLVVPQGGEDLASGRLFIAQDTGGAIRGVQRADIFFGSDAEAADRAGTMNAAGNLIILVPKTVIDRQADGAAS